MKSLSEIKELVLKSSSLRRKPIIEHMESITAAEVDCINCTGKCCTFVANSMQMTLVETYDLYSYLIENSLWTEELVKAFEETIRSFRLENEISTGGAGSMRRTYTCPFFTKQSLGCPLPPKIKPYGCLGFNPSTTGVKDGENCSTDISLLEERENSLETEEELNLLLKSLLGLDWEKLPIPLALLKFHKSVKSLK